MKTVPLFLTNPENYRQLSSGSEIAIPANFDYVVAAFELEGYLTPDDRVVVVGVYGQEGIFCQAVKLEEVSERMIRVVVRPVNAYARVTDRDLDVDRDWDCSG
jgi:hypothetical protein